MQESRLQFDAVSASRIAPGNPARSVSEPSRKRILNPRRPPVEIMPETPPVESPDVSIMEMISKITDDRAHLALIAALFAASAVNLMLLCAWF
jgi:hypothetical protein